jgi:hypothetical protein
MTTKGVRLLPTNNIRTATAERTVVNHFRQMPPAATAFVVGGFFHLDVPIKVLGNCPSEIRNDGHLSHIYIGQIGAGIGIPQFDLNGCLKT